MTMPYRTRPDRTDAQNHLAVLMAEQEECRDPARRGPLGLAIAEQIAVVMAEMASVSAEDGADGTTTLSVLGSAWSASVEPVDRFGGRVVAILNGGEVVGEPRWTSATGAVDVARTWLMRRAYRCP